MAEYKNKQEGEVDFVGMISILWQNRKYIFKVCGIGAVIGLVIGYSIPKTYESMVSFAPETEQQIGSGVSSIASMMGVSLDNSVDAISVDMFPDVIASTPFLFDLFDLQVETVDTLNTTLLDYMKNHQKKPWWSHVIGAPFKALAWMLGKDKEEEVELDITNLPQKERDIIEFFAKNIVVDLDKKTGKANISVRMQDPLVSATVLNAVVENLKQYMCDYRTSKDRQDVENLKIICEQRKMDYYKAQKAYADFADANKNLVKLNAQAEQLKLQQEMQLAYQVYSQVATQLEGARIKEQQAKPVFVIVEPVTIPLRKAAPSKAKILIAFVFLAGFFAAFWVLWGKEYYRKFKESN